MSYKGQYKEGKWHGQGERRAANGRIYRGEWQQNKKTGYGEAFQLEKFATQVTHLPKPLLSILHALLLLEARCVCKQAAE